MSLSEHLRLPTSGVRRVSLLTALLGTALVAGAHGCASPQDPDPSAQENAGEASAALADEADVAIDDDKLIGPIKPACPQPPACDSTITVNTTPSLVVTRQTHASLLNTHFQLDDVLASILDQANIDSQKPGQLYQRIWDTQNPDAQGVFQEAFQPHCDDDGQTVNGFPVACRPFAGSLATTPPSTFIPVALFNRFDLAPLDGSHCGEYRIVYAFGSSAFIIFEARLPNPRPACGVESCRPVADFWRNLSTITDPVVLGEELKSFYFTGLPGFRPVIHPNNYGLDADLSEPCGYGGCAGDSGGQIRTNDILHGAWHLDEFQLGRSCLTKTSCVLFPRRVSVKTNPFADLFDPASTHPLASEFQADFVAFGPDAPSNVQRLAASGLNAIGMDIAPNHDAGQSEVDFFDDYTAQFGTGANPFRTAIQGELNRIGSPLTPNHIIERALTQSCAGCHQLSNGAPLGGGLTWPSSLGFFHVSGTGQLSSALTGTFLPHRKTVLETFLRSCPTGKPKLDKSGSDSQDESESLKGTLGGSTTH